MIRKRLEVFAEHKNTPYPEQVCTSGNTSRQHKNAHDSQKRTTKIIQTTHLENQKTKILKKGTAFPKKNTKHY